MTIRYSIAMIVVFLVLTSPVILFAQGRGGVLPESIVSCQGADCTLCDIAKTTQNWMSVAIWLAVGFATFSFAFAGAQYIYGGTVGESKYIDNAHKTYRKVAFGFGLAIAAYLIVDTVMRVLTGAQFGPWNNICPGVA